MTNSTFFRLLQRIRQAWSLAQLRRIERRLLSEVADWPVRYLLAHLAQRERELAGGA